MSKNQIALDHLTEIKELGSSEEAIKQIQILVQKFPNFVLGWIEFGLIQRRLKQHELALNNFKIAHKLAPKNYKAQLNIARELKHLGNLDEANKIIDSLIKQCPKDIQIKILKGNILQCQADLNAAAKLYKSILNDNPDHLVSRLKLAHVYSQLGQIKTAITLLEESYQLLGADIDILIRLGILNQALEKWEIAFQWFDKACQEYPSNHKGYCHLAQIMFLQGEIDSATQLIQEAQAKIPDALPIILKSIEFAKQLGNFDLCYQKLKDALQRFPDNIELLWKLCSVYIKQGNYEAALEILDKISPDNTFLMKKNQELKAECYFHQYDYQKAEEHLKEAISLAPIATAANTRTRLALVMMITGRIVKARQELKIATEEITLKNPLGKTAVPLKSHTAVVTNELRLNPNMLLKLQAAQQATGKERILALGRLLIEEPNYLGASLYLAKELRTQNIFNNLQQALSHNATTVPTIPKRIVQFWNESQPPQEVQRICQSWLDYNPEYQYARFSLETAIAFLKQHYDQKVLTAFANCDQPAIQSDFFRLAYLNKMGGFYVDADDLCRQSLDNITSLNPELVVLQEEFACIGNNFLGCIPGQSMIRTAFHQATINLNHYNNEGPWFNTGPALITSVVCSGLIPYLNYPDYYMWPRILVLSQAQLRKIVIPHLPLPYKRTNKSWQQNAYQRRIGVPLKESATLSSN
ncbi:MAG: tetratricopeptide repeat protein [Cyanobacteria bacterium J06621_8]